MKCSGKSRQKYCENEKEGDIPPFQTFNLTYKLISGIMCVAMMYPNSKTDKWRLLGIVFVGITSAPFIVITSIDMWHFFINNDLANIIRISTVSGPFLSITAKMSLFYFKRREIEAIIQEMERDYASANQAPKQIRRVVHEGIKTNMFYEKFWTTCVFIAVFTFPLFSTVMNVYSNMCYGKNAYMITDLRNPFSKEEADRFMSPYFEIMYAYTFYCCCNYFLYFTTIEVFMMLSIGHACLKFEIVNAALEDAMLVRDAGQRKTMVSAVIREQNRAFWFAELIRETFRIWLGVFAIAILVQLCCCMFYILEGYGFDVRYSIFTSALIIYLYLICNRCHQIKATVERTPTRIFCCGWHSIPDVGLRKVLCFMIARFQKPVEIRALYFFLFDMNFFVFIVKTAYSMFTLLKK